MSWVLDLDGVVWRGDAPIEGSPEAIARLQALGHRVVYATNNSGLDTAGYVAKLDRMNIPAEATDIVHAGFAIARVVKPGSTVLSCAGIGVAEAIGGMVKVIDASEVSGPPPRVDAVIVGIRPDFRFAWLSLAVQAVIDGAALLAPSGDPLYPHATGFSIGGGSLARSIAYATKAELIIAGKPSVLMADAVRERAGSIEVLIGDQLQTDGRLAQQLGVPFVHVASGVRIEEERDVPVAHRAENLSDAVDIVLGEL